MMPDFRRINLPDVDFTTSAETARPRPQNQRSHQIQSVKRKSPPDLMSKNDCERAKDDGAHTAQRCGFSAVGAHVCRDSEAQCSPQCGLRYSVPESMEVKHVLITEVSVFSDGENKEDNDQNSEEATSPSPDPEPRVCSHKDKWQNGTPWRRNTDSKRLF